MVSAISSSTLSSVTSATSSTTSGGNDASKIEAQIAAKKAELANTKDPTEAQTLQKDITTLQAQLDKLQKSSDSQKTSGSQQAGGTKSASSTQKSGQTDSSTDGDDSKLSGESDRIGSKNYDEDSTFGDRTTYV
jgi:predicted  nucleic acid-binding Zn-ribbon protein